MSNNYGLPYMGSKNTIASTIIKLLPKAERFYDLFCGGCSITEAAILSKKYREIYFNDIEKGLPDFFLDAVKGKYKNEKRWISRDLFYELKDKDPYVRYCWSFGNKGENYLYSKEIEPYKKAYWFAVMFNDYSLFRNLGINIPTISAKTYKEKRLKISAYLKMHKMDSRCQSIERLERVQLLESLNRLERVQLLENLGKLEKVPLLESSCGSYDKVLIKNNSVIYCDIPYENTAEYVAGSFDHKKFYEWAYQQDELVVISSYNVSDKRFKRVVNLLKSSNLQGGNGQKKNEGLFVADNKIEKWKEMRK